MLIPAMNRIYYAMFYEEGRRQIRIKHPRFHPEATARTLHLLLLNKNFRLLIECYLDRLHQAQSRPGLLIHGFGGFLRFRIDKG